MGFSMSQSGQSDARRFQQKLNARLRDEAGKRSTSVQALRYQVVFECFLHRVFSADDSPWVLKGGVALPMRNGEGRFTKDLDMARERQWSTTEDVRREFEAIAARVVGDPFTFAVTKVDTVHGEDGEGYLSPAVRLTIQAFLGITAFEVFTIDVTAHRHTQDPFVEVGVEPVISRLMNDVGASEFFVRMTAVESHLADKVCAMYAKYSGRVSTRYRDLADIVTIVCTQTLSSERLAATLGHEAARRRMTLPKVMDIPGADWDTGFASHVRRDLALRREARTLEEALQCAGRCLNPILSGRLSGDAYWNFREQKWVS